MRVKNLLLALVVVASPTAVAATDGSLGSTSSGETVVSVSVPDLVQVTVQGDIALTHTVGSSSTGSTGLCIYRNGSSSVELTLTSANPDASNVFQMAAGTSRLPYSIGLTGGDTITNFTSGTAESLNGADSASSTCSGSYSHSMDVTVQSSDLDAAAAGSYSDTVTILVEPV
jgi:hypothetical protein